MQTKNKLKGSWWQRFAVRAFTTLFAILTYWLLGFLLEDIESMPGPTYEKIEKYYLNNEMLNEQNELSQKISKLSEQINNQKEQQKNLADSSKNLQETMTQLVELQKLSLHKGSELSKEKQANFTLTLNTFLDNQKSYQQLSQTISEMLAKKQELVHDKEQTEQQLEKQRAPARQVYQQQTDTHRLKLAFYQLAILLPLLLLAAYFFAKKRTSIYFPFTIAFGAAVLTKVAMVIHAYFPSQYFKYILTLSLLLTVALLLIRFIRAVAFPKLQWLLQQYREGYEQFLCPKCAYPMRIGPRRFLFWTHRTVHKMLVPVHTEAKDEIYTCPSCGHSLFEECATCHQVRHSLLPHCIHCGTLKSMDGGSNNQDKA